MVDYVHSSGDRPCVPRRAVPGVTILLMLWRDKFATAGVIVLLAMVIFALFGPQIAGEAGTRINLRMRNLAPFSIENGIMYVLGADSLGRGVLARVILGARSTLTIAASAVAISLVVGTLFGLLAGYRDGFWSGLILRVTDVLMSFPSLLLALVVLYIFSPSIGNVILVLAITRIPIYLRTCRAQVLELRDRMFVTAARVTGAHPFRIVFKHILPMAAPTLVTVATLDFAFVMLSESSLSFLGLGVQAPDITWGLMVSEGRAYLGTAWWLSFFPGMAIALTTLSLNLIANWVRVAADPVQRWRLESHGGKHAG